MLKNIKVYCSNLFTFSLLKITVKKQVSKNFHNLFRLSKFSFHFVSLNILFYFKFCDKINFIYFKIYQCNELGSETLCLFLVFQKNYQSDFWIHLLIALLVRING